MPFLPGENLTNPSLCFFLYMVHASLGTVRPGDDLPLFLTGSQRSALPTAKQWKQSCQDPRWGRRWQAPRDAFQHSLGILLGCSGKSVCSWYSKILEKLVLWSLASTTLSSKSLLSLSGSYFLSSAAAQLVLCFGNLIILQPQRFVLEHVLGHVNVLVWFYIHCCQFKAYSMRRFAFLLHQCLSVDSPLPEQHPDKIWLPSAIQLFGS